MRYKFKILIVLIVLIFSSYLYNNFFTIGMISGTYVSNNTQPILEGPYDSYTLVLFDDNKFISETWGEGTYQLNYSIRGTQIDLNANDASGMGGFNSHLERSFYGKPRIVLFRDLNFYFEKIK